MIDTDETDLSGLDNEAIEKALDIIMKNLPMKHDKIIMVTTPSTKKGFFYNQTN